MKTHHRPVATAILLLMVLPGLSACQSEQRSPAAQDTTPLWASVPETISPEWGAFFSEKGQGREKPMPAPDDLEGWKAVQAANDEVKEAKADEKAGVEIHIAAEKPDGVPPENWLPSGGKDEQLDVMMRVYAPDIEAMKTWTAPKAELVK